MCVGLCAVLSDFFMEISVVFANFLVAKALLATWVFLGIQTGVSVKFVVRQARQCSWEISSIPFTCPTQLANTCASHCSGSAFYTELSTCCRATTLHFVLMWAAAFAGPRFGVHLCRCL